MKIKIKFSQFGVEGYSGYKGFVSSKKMLEAIANNQIKKGDDLYDYQTGTMWTVE